MTNPQADTVLSQRGHTRAPRKRLRLRLGLYVPLLLWTVIVYFPLYWLVITSFKTPLAVSLGSIVPWADFQPTLNAWQHVFGGSQSSPIAAAYVNSLIVGVSSALAATILGTMAGYGLARFKYKLAWMRNNDIAFWFISQRMLPPVAVVLSYLVLYQSLNLLDTRFGLSLAYMMFNLPLVVWIMRDFFRQIPLELEESAALEGASPLTIFVRISLPLAIPGVVSAFLLSLVFSFNEYLFALVLTNFDSITFPVVLASQVTGDSIRFWILSALALLNIVPAIIITLALERFFVGSIFSGSVK